MKKLLLIFCVGCFPGYAAYAQSHQQTLSLSLGASFPMGSFASHEAGLDLKNFAQTGLSGNISWQYLFSDGWGVTATVTGIRNPIDRRSLDKAYTGNLPEGYTAIFGNTDPGALPPPPSEPTHAFMPHATFSDAHWLTGGLLAGIVRQWPLDAPGNYTFALKLMAGISAVQSPNYQAKGGADSVFYTLSQHSRLALAPAVLGGAAFGYRLSGRWTIRLGLDYFTTGKVRFHRAKTSLLKLAYETGPSGIAQGPAPVASSTYIRTVTARVSMVQLHAGLEIPL